MEGPPESTGDRVHSCALLGEWIEHEVRSGSRLVILHYAGMQFNQVTKLYAIGELDKFGSIQWGRCIAMIQWTDSGRMGREIWVVVACSVQMIVYGIMRSNFKWEPWILYGGRELKRVGNKDCNGNVRKGGQLKIFFKLEWYQCNRLYFGI